jgi:YD repeat-containing protein
VLRTTFFPDDSVDVYTEFHYGDRIGGGAGSAAAERDLDLLEEVTFDHAGELVSRVRYDYAEGLLIAESASDDADELTATHSYEYNAGSNLVVSDTATDARDRVRSISLYQYDTEGRRTEWRLLGRDRVLLGYTQYEYGGSAVSAAHNFNAAGVLQETLSYVRDGQGRVLEERVTAAQGGELTRSEYAYAGDLPRATSYFSASQLVGVEEYAYDADGNRTSIRTLGGDGTLKTRIAVEYQTAAQIEAQR